VFSCILACPGALQRNDSLFFVSSFAVLFLSVSCTFPSLCLALVPCNGKTGRAGLLLSGGSPVAFSFAFACPGALQRKHTLKGRLQGGCSPAAPRLLAGCSPAAGRRHRALPPGGKGGFAFRKEKTNERQTKVKSKERQTKVKRKSIPTKLFGVSFFFVGLAFVFLLLSFSFFFLVFSFPFLFLSFPLLLVYSDYSERPLRSPVCRRHCVSSGRES
jgi:hypothetical protein